MAEPDDLVPDGWAQLLRGGGGARVADADLRDVDLEAWAEATDRRLLLLDTQDCSTERDLLHAFADAFEVDEDDDDCEWDGIDDCLADFDVAPSSGLVIVWTGSDGLDDDPEHVIPIAVDALVTASRTWADEGRPWAILVSGEGASWDLPWIGSGEPPWESDLTDDFDEDDIEDDPDEDEISDESYEYEDADIASDQLSSW